MSVFKDIEIDWKGETYKVRPSMQLIFDLESVQGSSLTGFATRAAQNDAPVSVAYQYVAKTLRHAGVTNVTAESIFEDVGGIRMEVVNMALQIVVACLNLDKEDTKKKTVK
jgi:hypothetical protein